MPNSVSPPITTNQSKQLARSSLATSIGASIKQQTVVWLVGFLIGILTLFSSKITESIRVAINSADLGSQNYEQLAMDLSEFIFQAELVEEFINHGWTTKKALEPLILEYNASVSKLRKREYVNLAWSDRYWGKDCTAALQDIMASLRQFDEQIHTLNDEFEKVIIVGQQKKVDPTIGKQAVERAHPSLHDLRIRSRNLLIDLLD